MGEAVSDFFCGLRNEADRKMLERIVGEWFEGATITPARGLWRGQGEDSRVIEILVNGSHMKHEGVDGEIKADAMIMGLVESLKQQLEQQAVLIVPSKIKMMEGYGVDSQHWTLEGPKW